MNEQETVVPNKPISMPAIGVDSLLHNSKSARRRVVSAVRENGFLVLECCFPAPEVLTDALSQMDIFFSLPDTDPIKQAALSSRSAEKLGWTPTLGEPAYQPGTQAHVESFDCGVRGVGRNLWPDLNGFKNVISDYWDQVFCSGQRVLEVIASGLGLEHDVLTGMCQTQALNTLRLLHYPMNDRPADEVNMGISAHTDFECLTLIYQTEPGLEVYDHQQGWVQLPCGNGHLVVLIGDMLERWTNGRLRATQHRVRNKHFGRQSLVLFIAVDPDEVVKPLAELVVSGEPSLFEPVTQRTHLRDEIRRAEENAAEV